MNWNGDAAAEPVFDLVVVGGGMGGLATAALAQRMGIRTALLEAHTKLGGCAGYFHRGDFIFDAGATALIGTGVGEPIGDLLAVLGVDFQTESSSAYRIHLPDRSFDIVPDRDRFEKLAMATFTPAGGLEALRHRLFWRYQEAIGELLLNAASHVPRFPLRSFGDLIHDLRILGPRGVAPARPRSLPSRTCCGGMVWMETLHSGP